MLTDHSIDPQNGKKPEYLVIFFHGYGSNGELMAQHVGNLLGPLLPEAKIRCPDGPIEIDGGLRSWFELRDLIENDKRPDSDEVARRAAAAAKGVNEYISKVIAEEGIAEDHVIIAGFSQGATMAFYAGLLRESKVGAVYSLSGGALDKLLQPVSRPAVGLVAGAQEQGDYSGAPHARKTYAALAAAGFRTDCVIIPDQGHDISWKSMELLAVYTRAVTSTPWAPEKQNNRPSGKQQNNAPRP